MILLALAFLAVPGQHDSFAKAPPLATALVDATVYGSPDVLSAELGALPAGTQIELTGEAAPGFIGIYYGGSAAWVPAQFLAISDRPGIDTAVAIVDTALLEAPMPEADVVTAVPDGDALILTGASVGGYNAASYEGAGGWVDHHEIAQ